MSRVMKTVFVMMVTICAGNVFAQSGNLSAKEHFDQGTGLYGAGEYEEAAVHFRRANELKPSWKLWFNIGQSEAACRRFGLALEAFEKYLALGGDNVGTSRFQEVVAEMRRLRELVGKLDISGGPDNAQVVVDGIQRATLPLEVDLRVTAGIPHELKIVTNDSIIHSQTVTVGSTSRVAISLGDSTSSSDVGASIATGPAPAGEAAGAGKSGEPLQANESITVNPNPGEAMDTSRLRPLKVAMLSSWVGTGLTLGIGIGFNAAAGGKETELNDLNRDLQNGDISEEDYNRQYDDAKSSMDRADTLAIAMWISSGVLATAAIITTAVYIKKKKQTAAPIAFHPSGVIIRF